MAERISPERLAQIVDDGEATIVDTRPEESFEAWHVPGAVNYPFGKEEALDGHLDALERLVEDGRDLVTICGKGISSVNLADQLAEATDAVTVYAVEDGMEGWSRVYEEVPVDVGGDVAVVQVQRRAKGCLSYLVGCGETGAAAVVDPTDDVETLRGAADRAELSVEAVIDTHVHADHVSGGRRLADELDVPYYLGARASGRDLTFSFEGLERNAVLDVGQIELKALASPGHTTEMISVLVEDRALLTADTLHVDSVGRTELEFGEEGGETGSRLLYETLHRTLLAEPEGLCVLPGHVTVTPDGHFAVGEPGEPISTTVRAARTELEVLSLEEDAFVDRLADAGEKPANFEEIIEINRGVREVDDDERTELELGPNNCTA